jgi:hypothetical protein
VVLVSELVWAEVSAAAASSAAFFFFFLVVVLESGWV